MKKVLTLLVAALLGTAATAQTWAQIATPFTATDINGNTVSLSDTLAAGKCVVIDYSCAWCGPCWNIHSNGVLESIRNGLGSQVSVIFVESERTNTINQLRGVQGTTGDQYADYTQGNWTVTSAGTPVPYPIIDDDNNSTCLRTCAGLYGGSVPYIVFIAPNGYYCSIYGESYGINSYTASAINANITGLINTYPRAGQAPSIVVSGDTRLVAGHAGNFTVSATSVDDITGYAWTFTGGTPASATTATASSTWNTPGTYTVYCTVTNTSGSATDSMTVTVIDDWVWGDVISYCGDGTMQSAIGTNGGDFTWGIKIPASYLASRDYLTNVDLYAVLPGDYTLNVYTGNETAPVDLVYSASQNITGVSQQSGAWKSFPIAGGAPIDATKCLWIAFSTSGLTYPAAYVPFVGDENGSYVLNGTNWAPIMSLNASLQATWMIRATTGSTRPDFDFTVSGPTELTIGTTANYSIAGLAAATYNWRFDNGNPPSASGMTAGTVWNEAGTYDVTVTGTLDGNTATKTLHVNVIDCRGLRQLPYADGFESGIDCWKNIDADGDGNKWIASANNLPSIYHNGANSVQSASYINNVGAVTPDNWLVSPQIHVPAEGATIEWWEYGVDANDYAEKYGVFISKAGDNVADFTDQVFIGSVPAARTWTKHSRSLNAFAGHDIYVAFRHFDCTNMFWLAIDDVNITAGNTAGIDNTDAVDVKLFPNPVSDRLVVRAEDVQEVSVIDVNGRTVLTTAGTTVDMSTLADGVYMVRVVTARGIATEKVVKK